MTHTKPQIQTYSNAVLYCHLLAIKEIVPTLHYKVQQR